MNRFAIVSAMVAALATAGVCFVVLSPPRMDGESKATYWASMQAVTQSLPIHRRLEFFLAVDALARSSVRPVAALFEDQEASARRARRRIDGMTRQQVFDAAASLPTADRVPTSIDENEAAVIAALKDIAASPRRAHRSVAAQSGYIFKVHEVAEASWCCYAWPRSLGKTGNRAFFVSQGGAVLVSSNTTTKYQYVTSQPQPGAATGADGETWVVAD